MQYDSESLVRIETRPTLQSLRSAGCALAVGCLGLALWSWAAQQWRLPATPRVLFAACGALSAAAFAWRWPGVYRLPVIALSWLSYPLRWLVALAFLAALYFAVITPIAWFVRARRRAARSWEHDKRGSAWIERATRSDDADYFRQF